eukprot:TRINITY_DN33651_c0_g1_i1.p1 TRINITY_DN33651_c0_g1~~TRINITY_DN33651_c0_g1_i1.p1  ORF type:complete len:571 (+),score=160.41 TRINITY_DN33651_c0_g1_i1:125-1837(+)
MTEFGRATKEVDELKEKYVTIDTSNLVSQGREVVEQKLSELSKVMNDIETGPLSVKAAKFKSKAEAPPDTRLYGEAMVAKVMKFLEELKTLLDTLKEAHHQLTTWLSAVKAVDVHLAELILSEEANRIINCFESTDLIDRIRIHQSWMLEAFELYQQHSSDVRDTEKRIRNREKKKAKRKMQQLELREAAMKKKEREKEVKMEELHDALEKLTNSIIRKETRGRKAIIEEEEDQFGAVLSGRKGRRTPTPPKGRSPPKSPGRKKTPPKGSKRHDKDEISFEDVPPNLTDPKIIFDITPIESSPSVLLTHVGVSITLYKTLLKLEELPTQPPFVVPEELLTDKKAKKKYLRSIEEEKKHQQYVDANEVEEDEEVSDDDILDIDAMEDSDEEEKFEDEDEDAVPTSTSISFIRNITSGCVVVMISVGGSFAGGIFSKGECVAHTTFSRYITRKKQGGRQSNHEGRSDTVGSQMRKRHENRYKELIIEQLITWASPLAAATAICLHAPGPMNRLPFYSPVSVPMVRDSSQFALKRSDKRIVGVPFTTHKPTFTEVQRIYKTLFTCKLEFKGES